MIDEPPEKNVSRCGYHKVTSDRGTVLRQKGQWASGCFSEGGLFSLCPFHLEGQGVNSKLIHQFL